MRAHYERFARFQAPAELQVALGRGAARDGQARVRLCRDYLDGVRIQQVTPPPGGVEAESDGLTFVFQMGKPARRRR
ncbi:MAG: hypothetical protein ACRDI2_01390 [Chloroflexota bacterium]